MKYFVRRVVCIVTLSLMHTSFVCSAIITFYLRQYPTISPVAPESSSLNAEKFTPTYPLSHYLQKSPNNVGILVTYGGYLAVSNLNGQVMFPRRHENPSMHILVTSKIIPIIMIANTVHHWEIEENVPAKMYEVERLVDPETNFLYWQVHQTQLPANKVIPLDTITILANPDHVFVPEGATLSNTNPQLILPDIYIKNGIERLNHALYTLNVKRFFGLVRFAYQEDALLFMELINN